MIQNMRGLNQDCGSHGGPRLLSEEIPWFALVDLKMQQKGPFCCTTFTQAPETGHNLSERCLGAPGTLGTLGVWGRMGRGTAAFPPAGAWLEPCCWVPARSFAGEGGPAGASAFFSSILCSCGSTRGLLVRARHPPARRQREQLRPRRAAPGFPRTRGPFSNARLLIFFFLKKIPLAWPV